MKNKWVVLWMMTMAFQAKALAQDRPVKVGPAFQALVEGVQKGDGLAMFELTVEQMESGCNLPIPYDTVGALKKLVAKEPHNAKAMAYLGLSMLGAPIGATGESDRRRRGEAAYWLQKAAEKEDIKAMSRLVELHWSGFYDEFPKNREKATKIAFRVMDILIDRAKKGDVEAMYGIYARKMGRSQALPSEFLMKMNPNQFEWLRMAAEKGHVRAMAAHGGRLWASEDRAKSEEGLKLCEKAASLGDWQIMASLGESYYYGNPSLKKDLKKAWYWWDRMVALLGCDGPLKGLEIDEGGPLDRPGKPAVPRQVLIRAGIFPKPDNPKFRCELTSRKFFPSRVAIKAADPSLTTS